VLVRSWNLYHGNTVPPGRRNFLERMVRLAAEDRPEVLCLQELPAWALPCLEGWSGMTAVADLAQRPMLGPLPSSAELGRRLTELNPGLLRSAFSGQGNGLLTTLEVLGRWRTVLNSWDVRRRTRADIVTKLAWGKERRICQAARLRLPILIIAFDDGALSLIRIKQEQKGYEGAAMRHEGPDLVALARAFGLTAFVATDEHGLRSALFSALATPGPTVIDARIDASGYRRMLEIVRGVPDA